MWCNGTEIRFFATRHSFSVNNNASICCHVSPRASQKKIEVQFPPVPNVDEVRKAFAFLQYSHTSDSRVFENVRSSLEPH